VELGAARILVLDAARCVARVGAAAAERKRAGWRLTLVAAMKQSGNPWLPVLEGPCAVADPAVRSLAGPDGRLYVAALRPGLPTLGLEAGRDPKAGTVAVAIGPEGDFTAEELGQFESFGARPVSLGPLVLRAETAAIAALAILGDHARR
jgi:16S rRNA (uracil1498-N3)-methyltransferase